MLELPFVSVAMSREPGMALEAHALSKISSMVCRNILEDVRMQGEPDAVMLEYLAMLNDTEM